MTAAFNAILNEEGRIVWGYAFPEGSIPVKSPFPVEGKISGGKSISAFLVDWAAFTEEQRNKVLEHLKTRFNSSRDEAEKAILKQGLPLQAKYVSTVPIPMRFFI